jgi:tRNA(fMet)-specific endonuclease VapC
LITPQSLNKNRVIVDTDVFSFLMKEDTRANFFKPFLINRSVAVSFITVAELYHWAYKRTWGQPRITELENRLKNYLIFPYEYSLCQNWAKTYTDCENRGYSISEHDCWIASTALLYDCALVTNNGSHFSQVNGLVLVSPNFI